MAEKKKKSKFKRILKGLKKAAILGGTAWGASKLFGGRRGPVSTVGQPVGVGRVAARPANLGETFHAKGPRIPDRITEVASGAKSGPNTWRDYLPWKKGGRVTGAAKRGFGRALMKGKK